MTIHLHWFPAKEESWNEGSYPLFVWQNHGNFMYNHVENRIKICYSQPAVSNMSVSYLGGLTVLDPSQTNTT